jgi:hypothetical protein
VPAAIQFAVGLFVWRAAPTSVAFGTPDLRNRRVDLCAVMPFRFHRRSNLPSFLIVPGTVEM